MFHKKCRWTDICHKLDTERRRQLTRLVNEMTYSGRGGRGGRSERVKRSGRGGVGGRGQGAGERWGENKKNGEEYAWYFFEI